ncbi:MAG: hypothetical protein IPM74_07735 [Crocinitomicaceae bacterium]|nr:hypothetical protein [Crocinitomicaceae bacterium]
MFKYIFAGIAFLSAFNAKADMRKSLRTSSGFVVVSDEFDQNVPVGKCLVQGYIYQQEQDSAGIYLIIQNGLVSTLDATKQAFSNEDGFYKILLSSADTSLYFFAEEFEEIVIWKYLFKSQHKVQIDFYADYNWGNMTVDKPVIYLYNDTTIHADLSFNPKSELVFTYPAYNGQWSFTVNQSSITNDRDNKEYPYLFWEGETKNLNFISHQNVFHGFIVNTDTLVSFLENTLTTAGLNQTEQTDFISFWAPKMLQHELVFIQFLQNDDYDKYISNMQINPQPETLIRLFMLYVPLENSQPEFFTTEQTIVPAHRTGFTLVEWGGSEIHTVKHNP